MAAHGQRNALEEGRLEDPPDDHQDQTENQRANADDGDGAHAEDRDIVAVVVGQPVRPCVLDQPVDEDDQQYDAAEQWHHAAHHHVTGVAGQRLSVVPDTGEPGEAVVERDHQTDRTDEGSEQIRTDDGEQHVEKRRDDAHHDRRCGRCQVPPVDLGERLGECLVDAHGQSRSRGRQDRCLRGGRCRRQDRRRQRKNADVANEAVAEQIRPDCGEYVIGVVGIAEADAVGADTGEGDGRNADQRVGGE